MSGKMSVSQQFRDGFSRERLRPAVDICMGSMPPFRNEEPGEFILLRVPADCGGPCSTLSQDDISLFHPVHYFDPFL